METLGYNLGMWGCNWEKSGCSLEKWDCNSARSDCSSGSLDYSPDSLGCTAVMRDCNPATWAKFLQCLGCAERRPDWMVSVLVTYREPEKVCKETWRANQAIPAEDSIPVTRLRVTSHWRRWLPRERIPGLLESFPSQVTRVSRRLG